MPGLASFLLAPSSVPPTEEAARRHLCDALGNSEREIKNIVNILDIVFVFFLFFFIFMRFY